MTNEEMDKRIEFMTEHLAHITAKLDETARLQAQSEPRLSRLEESFVLLVQMAKLTDSRLDDLEQNMNTLTRNVDALATMQAQSEIRLMRVEESLAVLIQIVERHIS